MDRSMTAMLTPILVSLLLATVAAAPPVVGRGGHEPSLATARSSEGGASTPTEAPLIVFLGDSLTAGLGVAESDAFPAIATARLLAEGHRVRTLNAGVSGDTSAGGLRRLEWLLAQRPDLVVVCLGANDGLRGLPLEQTEDNLRRIVARARAADAAVLLVGMLVPPNYGPEYAPAFAALFPRIAKDLDVPLVPFLLEGVGGRTELNQADGIHPTAAGHRVMAGTVYPALRKLVAALD
jgi:acyl-CoA thioesterase-1